MYFFNVVPYPRLSEIHWMSILKSNMIFSLLEVSYDFLY